MLRYTKGTLIMICYGHFTTLKKKKLKQDAVFFVLGHRVSVVLASLELKNIPTSASLVLELKLCIPMPS